MTIKKRKSSNKPSSPLPSSPNSNTTSSHILSSPSPSSPLPSTSPSPTSSPTKRLNTSTSNSNSPKSSRKTIIKKEDKEDMVFVESKLHEEASWDQFIRPDVDQLKFKNIYSGLFQQTDTMVASILNHIPDLSDQEKDSDYHNHLMVLVKFGELLEKTRLHSRPVQWNTNPEDRTHPPIFDISQINRR